MNNNVRALWLQYLEEERVGTWMDWDSPLNPDYRRLRRIDKAKYKLMNSSEGVHFEGDG